MTRPLRVLHVVPSLSVGDGGPTRALLDMEAGLAAVGVDVTTVTTWTGRDEPPPRPPDGVRRIRVRRWASFYKLAPGLAPTLPALLRGHDVVHVHALFSFAPNLAALGACALGVPYIVRPLGTLGRYGLTERRPALKRLSLACIEGPILRGAAAVHFTSATERQEAEALGVRMRGVVIPLGVSPPSPATGGFDHPALAGRTVLLFLSRLDPKKNLEGLLDALSGSTSFAASATLVVAGDGPAAYVAALKDRAARGGLSDRVVWLGRVDGARKAAVLAAADIFVLPSFSENFGIAAIEALAAGLPCVLGRGVAVAEEIAAAGAGVAVAPEAAALRATLDGLIGDPGARSAMRQRGRALAAERYSTAAMTQRLVALYEEIRVNPHTNSGLTLRSVSR